MVELVDTLALGASAVRREGSSPFIRTNTRSRDLLGFLFILYITIVSNTLSNTICCPSSLDTVRLSAYTFTDVDVCYQEGGGCTLTSSTALTATPFWQQFHLCTDETVHRATPLSSLSP